MSQKGAHIFFVIRNSLERNVRYHFSKETTLPEFKSLLQQNDPKFQETAYQPRPWFHIRNTRIPQGDTLALLGNRDVQF